MTTNLIVGLVDGNGNLLTSQPYDEYQYGRRSTDILIPVRGRRLLSILQDDLGNIFYEDNRLVLKYILTLDLNISAMTLLGKIAEAVLVRRCAEDARVNKSLFQIARRRVARARTLSKFKAIGTGLKQTQRDYPKRYSTSDPQRDIIWVDEEGVPALMDGGTYMSGIIAGLQIKVSLNGINYVPRDLLNNRYEVPMIYFPLRNDYEQILSRLERDARTSILDPVTGEYRRMRPEEDFVDIRAYDYDAYEEVKDYYPLVYALLEGDIEPANLVDIAMQHRDPVLKDAVMLSALQNSNLDQIIVAQSAGL